MTTKLKWSLLIVIALIEFSLCTTDDIKNVTQEEESSEIPKFRVLLHSLNEAHDIDVYYANKAQNISSHLLKDPVFRTSTSFKVQEFKNNLTKFIEEFEEYKDIDIFGLAEFYFNATSFYFEIPKGQLNADTIVIVNLLQKYGADNLDKEFKKLYKEFILKFTKQYENIKATATEEELKKDHNVVNWFNRFETYNFYQKIKAFEKFSTT